MDASLITGDRMVASYAVERCTLCGRVGPADTAARSADTGIVVCAPCMEWATSSELGHDTLDALWRVCECIDARAMAEAHA